MRCFRMAASAVGFCCLVTGQAHSTPMILQAGEVLEVRFDLPAVPEATADYLSFGIDTVDVVEAFTSRTARLYDATTLLAEHAPADPFGDYVGPLMMGGAFGWKSPQSLWTWGLPPAIDFSPILDATIDGRIEMRIATGRIAFDPNDVHVRLLHAQGDNWGTEIDPAPRIVSVEVVPETGPVLTVPNGGQTFRVGQIVEILWYGGAPADPIDIEYSTNDGRTWSPVATVANTGRFEWTVPPVVSAQCRIRLRQADAFDTSDATFVVYQCRQNVDGDLNGDCRVDLQDLALFAGEWLAPGIARIHAEPLDDDPGWTTQGQWAFGPPQGAGGTVLGHPDPATGATGQNVYGVNLEGDYTVAAGDPMRLTAGPTSPTCGSGSNAS